LLDGNDLQLELPGQGIEFIAAGAIAVAAEDLTDHAGRAEAGHAGQVDGALGMPGPPQDSPSFAIRGNRWPDGPKIVRLAVGIEDRLDRRRPLLGRDSGAATAVIDGDCKPGLQRGRVILDHQRQLEPLADVGQDRHAELSPTMSHHEIDDFRGDRLGRTDEIAFVFPVLGVHDDDDPPLGNGLNRGIDSRQSL